MLGDQIHSVLLLSQRGIVAILSRRFAERPADLGGRVEERGASAVLLLIVVDEGDTEVSILTELGSAGTFKSFKLVGGLGSTQLEMIAVSGNSPW